jgi:hypothetical protein
MNSYFRYYYYYTTQVNQRKSNAEAQQQYDSSDRFDVKALLNIPINKIFIITYKRNAD